MVAKRRARRPRSDEETTMSAEPKEMPLKQEQPSPSPARSAPRGGVALKAKTASKRPARSDGDETVASWALHQLRKAVLTKPPTSPPSSSPDIAQEDEHHGRDREMSEQEQSNTSLPQEKQKIAEQDHAGDTSSPHDKDKDMHRPHNSETEKKPWSCDDEFKILNALVAHAQSHNGALPDSAHLLANLTFDKTDATEDKLTDMICKLRRRYCKFLLQGCPSDGLSRRLFKLSEILWGQADEDERVEPTSRDFSVLSKLYPHLAKEVKAYAETHSSGDLVMAMFMTIGDDKARDLEAKCKKQHIEAFKLELGQVSLTNELLSALSSLTTNITDPSQATTRKRSAKNLEEPLDEQYLRHSKRVAGMTKGFKGKPNADQVYDPKPLAMAPPATNS